MWFTKVTQSLSHPFFCMPLYTFVTLFHLFKFKMHVISILYRIIKYKV